MEHFQKFLSMILQKQFQELYMQKMGWLLKIEKEKYLNFTMDKFK